MPDNSNNSDTDNASTVTTIILPTPQPHSRSQAKRMATQTGSGGIQLTCHYCGLVWTWYKDAPFVCSHCGTLYITSKR